MRLLAVGDISTSPNDESVSAAITIRSFFFTDPPGNQVWYVSPGGKKRVVAKGFRPNGVILWRGGGTLVVATAEGNVGREHHPFGFTMWLAGGGVRGGMVHGATDEFGWHAAQDIVHVHDLHATILHLMGVDHERLTFRHSGRDYRLTDVYGQVVKQIIV